MDEASGSNSVSEEVNGKNPLIISVGAQQSVQLPFVASLLHL